MADIYCGNQLFIGELQKVGVRGEEAAEYLKEVRFGYE